MLQNLIHVLLVGLLTSSLAEKAIIKEVFIICIMWVNVQYWPYIQ